MSIIYIHTKSGMMFTTKEVKTIGSKLRFVDIDSDTVMHIDMCHITKITTTYLPVIQKI